MEDGGDACMQVAPSQLKVAHLTAKLMEEGGAAITQAVQSFLKAAHHSA